MRLDDSEDSPALDLWKEQLGAYLDSQEGVEGLRDRSQPNPPWPEADNPVVGYLIARALEINDEHGLTAAVSWAVVHAWFESALDTRAALVRQLGA